MKRLLLIRHAKSNWDFPELNDHDRPLNKRGKRDCLTMSTRLLERGEVLSAVVSSTAKRALSLAESITNKFKIELFKGEAFYTFSSIDLFNQIRLLPDQFQHIGVVGHNPAITDLVNNLIDINLANVPTSGIVAIDCEINKWEELNFENCKFDFFDCPKSL
jgi:phosphohistidine phosphatase